MADVSAPDSSCEEGEEEEIELQPIARCVLDLVSLVSLHSP